MKCPSKMSADTCKPQSKAALAGLQTTVSGNQEKILGTRQHNTFALALRSGILAGMLALPAMAHATVIEFSVSGIVAKGVDEMRLFSNYGESIVGKAYTMRFWLDTATLTDYGTGTMHGAGSANTDKPVHFSGEVTMGNRSYGWTLDPDGRAGLYLGPKSNAMMEGYGTYDQNRYQLWSMIGVFPGGSAVPYFDSLEFEQRIEFKDFVDPWGYSAEFQLTYTAPFSPGDFGTYTPKTNFVGTGTYALWQVREVPEPAQVAMLLAGLTLVARAARRNRRSA